jgi:hypothetical protein
MNKEQEFEEEVDALCEAFANLTAIVFARSATLQEAVREVELILGALHGTVAEGAVKIAMGNMSEKRNPGGEE